VKASVLDARGRMLHDRVKVDTPKQLTPRKLVSLIGKLVAELPRFDRVSVGFPGVVRDGVVRTAPNLGTERFHGFNLARALERELGKPVRVENDADVQGLAVVKGKGVEMVITLGTGVGSALFLNGRLVPNLELGHHPFQKDKTYEERLSDAELKEHGKQKWSKRVGEMIELLSAIFNYDKLHIGGGNAEHIKIDLPDNVSIFENVEGMTGGIRLWDGEEL